VVSRKLKKPNKIWHMPHLHLLAIDPNVKN